MALQERLSELRKAKGLSVAELAEASGVSIPYIHQIEKGPKRNPSGEILQKLAAGLGTTVADLIGTTLVIPEDALRDVPPSLRSLARRRGKYLDLRQEDIDVLKNLHFRGKRPSKEKDWELIFLLLKRILE